MKKSTLYTSGDTLKALLNDNWSLSQKPQIAFVWEEKTVGFMDDRKDFILINPTTEGIQYFSLYARDFLHDININLDIYTYQNLEHNQNVVSEVFRIVKENVRGTDYVDLLLMSSSQDNDLYRNIYRHSLSVRYRILNP